MTTREQIIAAAKEADSGFDVTSFDDHNEDEWAKLERFHTIVFEAGRVAEREACAALCYEQNWLIHGSEMSVMILATKEEVK